MEETPFEEMPLLVATLASAVDHWLDEPFALFGHSMGAGVAFELTRELRRRGRPLPQALIVSGARAPQLRAGWTPPPDPTDAELIDYLRRHDGAPPDLLDNPEALRIALPALRADIHLFSAYTYAPEPPLPVPITAYAGVSDLSVKPEQIAAWNAQTSAAFRFHQMPGGHFFLQSAAAEFLRELAADLAALTPA